MATVVLVSCGSKKRPGIVQAQDLYIGNLFVKSLKYAQLLQPDQIFILSAKYGLLSLDEVICSYDKTLKKMSSVDRASWGEKVAKQLSDVRNIKDDKFIVLAGQDYLNSLRRHIHEDRLQEPLKGKNQGQRLEFLKNKINCHDR